MALMYARYPHPEPIERAVQLVMSRQLPVRESRPLISRLRTDECDSGRVVGAGSDRGRFQQKLRDLLPELQVLVHDMDAREGAYVLGATKGEEKHQRLRHRASIASVDLSLTILINCCFILTYVTSPIYHALSEFGEGRHAHSGPQLRIIRCAHLKQKPPLPGAT